MPEVAKVIAKYFPISHKDINLVVVAKSTYIQFLTKELNLPVKGGQNPANILL